MKHWSESRSLRVKLLALLAALLPTGLFLLLLQGPALSLAGKRLARQAELGRLRENVYREDWLDSAGLALRAEVARLGEFHHRVRGALSSETRAETISDPLRREAQAAGCEVMRLSASRDSSGGLRRIRMRLEARADYVSAMRFFRILRVNHPEVYLDEALIRDASDPGQKLSLQISMIVHLVKPATHP